MAFLSAVAQQIPLNDSGNYYSPDNVNAALQQIGVATVGWRDLVGVPQIRTAGANDPSFAVYRGTIRLYQFALAAMNELWFTYHVDHDFKINGEIYIHTHWSQNVVDTGGPAGAPGNAKWYFDCTFAKGHQQMAFIAPITTNVVQQGSTTQYMHNIAEVQLASPTPNASQFDSALIEPDTLIHVRCYRDGADVADTLNQAPFLHTCDMHYQTDHTASVNKAPPFYG